MRPFDYASSPVESLSRCLSHMVVGGKVKSVDLDIIMTELHVEIWQYLGATWRQSSAV
jgi:hypothetical protein